jgi:ATP-binding cassette subfamily B protein
VQKYRTLLRYARPQRSHFIRIFVLTVVASAVAALQPWPVALLIDVLLKHGPLPAWLDSVLKSLAAAPTPARLLTGFTAAGLVIFALSTALDFLLVRSWTVAGRRMVYDLAGDLFARLQLRSLVFHTRNSVGDAMSRITVDSWCVYQLFDTLFFAPLHALLLMAGMIFLMARLDGTLTILAIAIAPCTVAASFFAGKPLRAAARQRREIESRIQAHIQQTLTGIPVVQAFTQEDRELARFEQFAARAVRAQQRSTLIGNLNNLGSGLVTVLGTGVILWIGARHVMEGRLLVGSLFVFLPYLNSVQMQMKVLANTYTALQGFHASVERVIEILEARPEIEDKPGAVALPPAHGHVQIEEVTVGYESGRPVLRRVSLEAQPGQRVALVGATGAGKTTLVNLIPRFLDPWEGRVRVDGCDLRGLKLGSLRAQIALVLQEPFLFPASVTENIAYGRPGASPAEIKAAARAARADDFIEKLPQGYATIIGERGATLSGGERQRLAIARAILRNAPILILDEPASALDAQTEQLILDALAHLMKDRTTFLVAHRLSTVRSADQVVVLQDGRIVESGTHAQLLRRGQVYAKMQNLWKT